MIDPDQRAIETECQRLAVHHAHQQGAHQSGTGCYRYAVQILKPTAGFSHRLLNDGADGLDVRAAGQLGNDPAENAMHILREDDQRDQRGNVVFPADHRSGGLVAGGLDAKYQLGHFYCPVSSSSRVISARFTGEFQSWAPITRFTITPSRLSRKLSGTPVV